MKGKKGKKERARIGGDCTDGRGRRLTVCTVCAARKLKFAKTKVERGKQLFPRRRIVPPFGYVALSHLAHIPMPLHSFVLQLPSPSRCIWCQLDKCSFFFSPFISNLCRTMSTAISLSPPPLLSCTQAIPRRCCHQPLSLPRQHPATSPIP